MKFKNQCLQNGLIDDDNFGVKLEFADTKDDNDNINDIDSFQKKCIYIFNRFISDRAEYCINVSSSTRHINLK